jgi:hypothetical protein
MISMRFSGPSSRQFHFRTFVSRHNPDNIRSVRQTPENLRFSPYANQGKGLREICAIASGLVLRWQ